MENNNEKMEVRDIDVHEEKGCKKVSNKVIVLGGLISVFVIALVAVVAVYIGSNVNKTVGTGVGKAAGNNVSSVDASKKDDKSKKLSIQQLVEMGDWVRFAEERDMEVGLTFDSLTNEFYYCEDSEPYMGYDVYEKYRFISDNKIELYSTHHKNKEYAEVISVDEDTLVIKIGDVEDTFTNEAGNYDDTKPFDYSSCDKCKKVVADGTLGVDIRRVDGDSIHMARGGDETKLYDIKLAANAKIYDVYVEESFTEEDVTHKCEVKEITKDDIVGLIDVVYPYGLIWFNEAKEIEKLVIYRVNSDYEVSEM
jgi:hypothetical protein